MPKYLTIPLEDLRAASPCSDSWKFIVRTFDDTAHLDQLLEKMIASRVPGATLNMEALDWGFWSLRLWTADVQVKANICSLAKYILQYTLVYVGDRDVLSSTSLPLAYRLLSGQVDESALADAQNLRTLYELDGVRPPVYYALGSDVGEFVSDLALSAFFYAGMAGPDLLLHYEKVLLEFAKHDHNLPFTVRS